MKIFKTLFGLSFALLFLLVAGGFQESFAGGPLFVASNGKPVVWAKQEIKGGPIGSNTVNAQGQVVYRVDSGPLGPLSNAEGVRLVDRIFKLYTDIPTATIEFVNGGPIKSPATNAPIDVDRTNVGMVVSSRNPSFQNPIVFDTDGSIIGRGGVLGVFFFLQITQTDLTTLSLTEGGVILNGGAINSIGKVPFIGVFTHEFGHFAGPLDHSQLNGGIAESSDAATIPDGYTASQQFDVFAPFIETVYPFLFRAPSGSKLAGLGFGSSGGFITSLSFDDVLAMSFLYPTPGYLPSEPGSQVGGITGRIVIRTPSGDFPVTGLNVTARRISLGKYPPDPNTDVYKGSVPTDADGAPLRPTDRPDLDPLFTAASFSSGQIQNDGKYQFIGLPPGDYLISVERIDPNFLGGSSVGPRGDTEQLNLLVPESYSGSSESNDPKVDSPKSFTPVTVTAGNITQNIDIVLNGFGLNQLNSVSESEPNEAKKQAQRLNLDSVIAGNISGSDSAKVKVDFGQNQLLPVQDLYRIDLKSATSLMIFLDADNINKDIDLFIFTKSLKNGTVSIDNPAVLDGSFGATGSEAVGTGIIPAGTYYIGVSSGQDSAKYNLKIFAQK